MLASPDPIRQRRGRYWIEALAFVGMHGITAFRTSGKDDLTDGCRIVPMPAPVLRKSKAATKVKVTVSLTRSAVASLDRISAKRVEEGAGRRQVQQSALIEEAILALREKERV